MASIVRFLAPSRHQAIIVLSSLIAPWHTGHRQSPECQNNLHGASERRTPRAFNQRLPLTPPVTGIKRSGGFGDAFPPTSLWAAETILAKWS